MENYVLETFFDMTWRNPIFMAVAIGSIWFIPGLIARRIAEKRSKAAKAQQQVKKISRLYPKKDENHST